MFAGHFGVAAAVKAKSPEVPLWALMLSTQLLDVIFVPLFLFGAETIVPVAGNGYGGSMIHAEYSHSLIGSLVISLFSGLLAARFWGRRGGLVIGSVVFSHWLLDLLVHRPDLPIFPGNVGNLPLLGFGLWNFPVFSIIAESILISLGIIFYFRSIVSGTKGRNRVWAISAGAILSVLLVLSLFTDVLGAA
ncbi:permease [Bacillus sp. V3-13]|uniref:permease n=1 Tax=Bacillus sp. V3-13 TaxID=2053728 RepID=UPI000C759E25|nr:permease [Bacillus sp. V3-13]PLR76303.1 permease [Bacillus sp. V3-13]